MPGRRRRSGSGVTECRCASDRDRASLDDRGLDVDLDVTVAR